MAERPVQSRSSNLIEEFLAQFSGLTLSGYGQALRSFRAWCERHDAEPLELNSSHFVLYDDELTASLAPSSIHTFKGVVQRFYNYLVKQGELAESPIPPGWRPPQRYRVNPDRVISPASLRSIEAAAAELGAEHVVLTRLIIELGLLPGAISKIEVEDLSTEGVVTWLQIRHQHGTGHPRRALGPELAAAMRELVGSRSTGLLLRAPAGGRMDGKRASKVLHEATELAGAGKVSATVLRQSQAAALVQSGVPPAQVEALLGGRARRLVGIPSEGLRSQSLHHEVVVEMLGLGQLLLDEAGAEPAASVVLSGGALEYFLKHLSSEAGLPSAPFGGMNLLATALRAEGSISSQERKEIEVWAGLRDAAVRGDFGEVSSLEARRFIEGCIAFVDRHRPPNLD